MDFRKLILDNTAVVASVGETSDFMDIHFSLRILMVSVALISFLAAELRRKRLETGESILANNAANEIGR